MSNNLILHIPVNMRRYAFISTVSVVSLTLISNIIEFKTDFDVGNNFGNLLTLLSTLIGILTFYRMHKRPMLAIERLRFSIGFVIGQFFSSIFMIVLFLRFYGLPVSFEGLGMLLGDIQGFLTPTVWVSFTIFFSILVFIQAYFFCWLIGRKYKRKESLTK